MNNQVLVEQYLPVEYPCDLKVRLPTPPPIQKLLLSDKDLCFSLMNSSSSSSPAKAGSHPTPSSVKIRTFLLFDFLHDLMKSLRKAEN